MPRYLRSLERFPTPVKPVVVMVKQSEVSVVSSISRPMASCPAIPPGSIEFAAWRMPRPLPEEDGFVAWHSVTVWCWPERPEPHLLSAVSPEPGKSAAWRMPRPLPEEDGFVAWHSVTVWCWPERPEPHLLSAVSPESGKSAAWRMPERLSEENVLVGSQPSTVSRRLG